ncbi:protease modulator HflC [Umboniibacter marinipuniceus]|uniref:Protein HflC n=1 Tax=Umboniibacter marinipuniceus TaxID=569599 RepID=A0A3M0ABK8_9GAMM|nr:protease modulator HflC [Umboniibacter marinipuniceus]RMA82270.1 protease FtsH subunit HflC [Umboniibacter marinipuniceus]
MNSNKPVFILIGLLVLAFIASKSLYVVSETERAVKLRFGKMEEADIAPGLHLKVPFVEDVRFFDARVQTLDAPPEDFLNAEKKLLTVDSFAKWRIIDVDRYYTSTNGDVRRAASLLAQRISEGLRNEFALRSLSEAVALERDEMMEDLTAGLVDATREQLGIEIVDVRVKKIELPNDVSSDVFRRMRAERERQAREYRSQGQEVAEGIRADADRQKIVIEANAYRDAEILRGEGDARAAAIYAESYGKDTEFYTFWRSLDAYRHTFNRDGDIMVLQPDSEFFNYLKDSNGKAD